MSMDREREKKHQKKDSPDISKKGDSLVDSILENPSGITSYPPEEEPQKSLQQERKEEDPGYEELLQLIFNSINKIATKSKLPFFSRPDPEKKVLLNMKELIAEYHPNIVHKDKAKIEKNSCYEMLWILREMATYALRKKYGLDLDIDLDIERKINKSNAESSHFEKLLDVIQRMTFKKSESPDDVVTSFKEHLVSLGLASKEEFPEIYNVSQARRSES